jgi:hypothetical protein
MDPFNGQTPGIQLAIMVYKVLSRNRAFFFLDSSS